MANNTINNIGHLKFFIETGEEIITEKKYVFEWSLVSSIKEWKKLPYGYFIGDLKYNSVNKKYELYNLIAEFLSTGELYDTSNILFDYSNNKNGKVNAANYVHECFFNSKNTIEIKCNINNSHFIRTYNILKVFLKTINTVNSINYNDITYKKISFGDNDDDFYTIYSIKSLKINETLISSYFNKIEHLELSFPFVQYVGTIMQETVSAGLISTSTLLVLLETNYESKPLNSLYITSSNDYSLVLKIKNDSELALITSDDNYNIIANQMVSYKIPKYDKADIIPMQVVLGFNATDEGCYLNTILLYLNNNTYEFKNYLGFITVKTEVEGEDERYRTLFTNFGIPDPINYPNLFKECEANDESIDYKLINRKSKELFMTYTEIFPYSGTYKALINAINFLGYNDIIFKEWYRIQDSFGNLKELSYLAIDINTGETLTNKLKKIGVSYEDFLNYNKLNKLTMIYHLNTLNDYNIEEITLNEVKTVNNIEGIDSNGNLITTEIPKNTGNTKNFYFELPNIESVYTYRSIELLTKLHAVKKWLEYYIIGTNAYISDISGEGIYFGLLKSQSYVTYHNLCDFYNESYYTPKINNISEFKKSTSTISCTLSEFENLTFNDFNKNIESVCPICKGTGIVNNKKCTNCNGTGKILSDVVEDKIYFSHFIKDSLLNNNKLNEFYLNDDNTTETYFNALNIDYKNIFDIKNIKYSNINILSENLFDINLNNFYISNTFETPVFGDEYNFVLESLLNYTTLSEFTKNTDNLIYFKNGIITLLNNTNSVEFNNNSLPIFLLENANIRKCFGNWDENILWRVKLVNDLETGYAYYQLADLKNTTYTFLDKQHIKLRPKKQKYIYDISNHIYPKYDSDNSTYYGYINGDYIELMYNLNTDEYTYELNGNILKYDININPIPNIINNNLYGIIYDNNLEYEVLLLEFNNSIYTYYDKNNKLMIYTNIDNIKCYYSTKYNDANIEIEKIILKNTYTYTDKYSQLECIYENTDNIDISNNNLYIGYINNEPIILTYYGYITAYIFKYNNKQYIYNTNINTLVPLYYFENIYTTTDEDGITNTNTEKIFLTYRENYTGYLYTYNNEQYIYDSTIFLNKNEQEKYFGYINGEKITLHFDNKNNIYYYNILLGKCKYSELNKWHLPEIIITNYEFSNNIDNNYSDIFDMGDTPWIIELIHGTMFVNNNELRVSANINFGTEYLNDDETENIKYFTNVNDNISGTNIINNTISNISFTYETDKKQFLEINNNITLNSNYLNIFINDNNINITYNDAFIKNYIDYLLNIEDINMIRNIDSNMLYSYTYKNINIVDLFNEEPTLFFDEDLLLYNEKLININKLPIPSEINNYLSLNPVLNLNKCFYNVNGSIVKLNKNSDIITYSYKLLYDFNITDFNNIIEITYNPNSIYATNDFVKYNNSYYKKHKFDKSYILIKDLSKYYIVLHNNIPIPNKHSHRYIQVNNDIYKLYTDYVYIKSNYIDGSNNYILIDEYPDEVTKDSEQFIKIKIDNKDDQYSYYEKKSISAIYIKYIEINDEIVKVSSIPTIDDNSPKYININNIFYKLEEDNYNYIKLFDINDSIIEYELLPDDSAITTYSPTYIKINNAIYIKLISEIKNYYYDIFTLNNIENDKAGKLVIEDLTDDIITDINNKNIVYLLKKLRHYDANNIYVINNDFENFIKIINIGEIFSNVTNLQYTYIDNYNNSYNNIYKLDTNSIVHSSVYNTSILTYTKIISIKSVLNNDIIYNIKDLSAEKINKIISIDNINYDYLIDNNNLIYKLIKTPIQYFIPYINIINSLNKNSDAYSDAILYINNNIIPEYLKFKKLEYFKLYYKNNFNIFNNFINNIYKSNTSIEIPIHHLGDYTVTVKAYDRYNNIFINKSDKIYSINTKPIDINILMNLNYSNNSKDFYNKNTYGIRLLYNDVSTLYEELPLYPKVYGIFDIIYDNLDSSVIKSSVYDRLYDYELNNTLHYDNMSYALEIPKKNDSIILTNLTEICTGVNDEIIYSSGTYKHNLKNIIPNVKLNVLDENPRRINIFAKGEYVDLCIYNETEYTDVSILGSFVVADYYKQDTANDTEYSDNSYIKVYDKNELIIPFFNAYKNELLSGEYKMYIMNNTDYIIDINNIYNDYDNKISYISLSDIPDLMFNNNDVIKISFKTTDSDYIYEPVFIETLLNYTEVDKVPELFVAKDKPQYIRCLEDMQFYQKVDYLDREKILDVSLYEYQLIEDVSAFIKEYIMSELDIENIPVLNDKYTLEKDLIYSSIDKGDIYDVKITNVHNASTYYIIANDPSINALNHEVVYMLSDTENYSNMSISSTSYRIIDSSLIIDNDSSYYRYKLNGIINTLLLDNEIYNNWQNSEQYTNILIYISYPYEKPVHYKLNITENAEIQLYYTKYKDYYKNKIIIKYDPDELFINYYIDNTFSGISYKFDPINLRNIWFNPDLIYNTSTYLYKYTNYSISIPLYRRMIIYPDFDNDIINGDFNTVWEWYCNTLDDIDNSNIEANTYNNELLFKSTNKVLTVAPNMLGSNTIKLICIDKYGNTIINNKEGLIYISDDNKLIAPNIEMSNSKSMILNEPEYLTTDGIQMTINKTSMYQCEKTKIVTLILLDGTLQYDITKIKLYQVKHDNKILLENLLTGKILKNSVYKLSYSHIFENENIDFDIQLYIESDYTDEYDRQLSPNYIEISKHITVIKK